MANKISIIVPVYNTQKYLRSSLNSILNQTYTNFEILLVDDGSTDRSGMICDEFASSDNRVHVFHTSNRGQAAARNLALDKATGDWIYFVDSDDTIEPVTLEKLLTKCLEGNYDISRIKIKYIYKDREETRKYNLPLFIDKNKCIDLLLDDTLGNYPVVGLYKKYIWDDIRFPEGRVYEDFAIIPKVYLQCKTHIGFIDEPLYNYNCHGDSTTRKNSPYKIYDHFLASKDRWELAKSLRSKSCHLCFHLTSRRAIGAFNYYLTTNNNLEEEKLNNIFEFLKRHKKEILKDSYNSKGEKWMFRMFFFNKKLYAFLVSTLKK